MFSAEQMEHYQEQGYLVVDSLFGQDEINLCLRVIEEITQTDAGEKNYETEPKDSSMVRRIWSPTQKHQVFWNMAIEPKLLDPIEAMIGKNIFFHYSKLNMKGPEVGSAIEWHQDFSYYPHTNTSLLTALIFFDEANVENGCLRVIPGSHKAGLLSHEVDGHFRGMVKGIDEASAVNLEVPAGSVVFLHCLTLHASHCNTSNKPRRTFLPAYRAADAFPIYFGSHATHNEPGIRLIRGESSKVARVESGVHYLPLAERLFGSIFDVQEGSHLTKDINTMQSKGYATSHQ
jgi:phytanoyl-CoA hydroxylase